jgi:hypothetical protein
MPQKAIKDRVQHTPRAAQITGLDDIDRAFNELEVEFPLLIIRIRVLFLVIKKQ